MLVTCGRRSGLIAAITRLVHFGEPDDTLKERHRAVCDVDAAMILATVPDRPVTDALAAAREAYAANGFPDEWKLHHQGGATGYRPREYLVTPDTTEKVYADQAFGWNPSITGTKSEDTILVGEEGVAFITAPTATWPTLTVERDGTTIERADILVK
jgi:antitoxin VapB